MPLDQDTRNRLQRFVTDARELLTDEFTRQLQQDYGMDPEAGTVADLASLTHLDDTRLETAQLLRDIQAHYLGAAQSGTAKKAQQDVLLRIAREQAFTVLNRLVALRMMEARGLLPESIAQGYQSKGFELYGRLAGPALGDSGDAYRCFLFSVFDEFATDLPQLFDRYSPQGRLFPRDTALLDLLALINDQELESLWAEDETIGWIYQYFNSKEERKEMRKSRAPRNARELAVRNQFFTPRYVVELLVDNSLGRAWFDWTGGQTELYDRCRYLLRKPGDAQELTEMTLRDPRGIKLLDPACGSMHFGLYAFDLFEVMYREAWDWEQANGSGSLTSDENYRPLKEVYTDQDALLLDVPRLIIEHNIYGVDIDFRATQIASLALWLRAQRSWHDAGIKAKDRPAVGQGHVIAAVAPPAEPELREQMAANLDTNDAKLFEETLKLLKGLPELGVLLRTEQEIPQLIQTIYGDSGDLFAEEDMSRWEQAERRLREALEGFIKAAQATYLGRLFAYDALEGLRLMDLMTCKFDVIVMNPPFGESARGAKSYIDSVYKNSKGNLLTNFVDRASSLLSGSGRIGALVSRSCFFLKSFSKFRRLVLDQNLALESFTDLGPGVLEAMVETSAVTWTKNNEREFVVPFFRLLVSDNKRSQLVKSIARWRSGETDSFLFSVKAEQFSLFEDQPYVYWITKELIEKLSAMPTIDPTACDIKVGLQTNDDFRFLRLWYEVSPDNVISCDLGSSESSVREDSINQSLSGKKWAWYSKTERSSAFQASIHLLANWERNGAEVKAFIEGKGHVASKHVMSESRYFMPGFSYMLRAERLVPYAVPAGVIPTAGRSQIFPNPGLEIWVLLLMGSRIASCVARFRGEAFNRPKFQNSMVGAVPYADPDEQTLQAGLEAIFRERRRVSERLASDESEILFEAPFREPLTKENETYSNKLTLLDEDIENAVAKKLGLTEYELKLLSRDLVEALRSNGDDSDTEIEVSHEEDLWADFWKSLVSYCVGCSFGRWDIGRVVTPEDVVQSPEEGPFDPLPKSPPGMLTADKKLQLLSSEFSDYPLHFSKDGLLCSDPGASTDIGGLVYSCLELLGHSSENDWSDMHNALSSKSLYEYLASPNKFFKEHLGAYSKSRRKAPIYWPLSTTSGSYSLWVYYPELSHQTLYLAANDHLGPKLKAVDESLNTLRSKSNRTGTEEREFEKQQDLQQELIELRDAILEIAPSYKPNHDDGVQITAAPLWPLFRHKPWQKVLKDTWEKLEAGDYDWAHLAYSYWPDRVREKCKTDKSLTIAHGLEELYEVPTS